MNTDYINRITFLIAVLADGKKVRFSVLLDKSKSMVSELVHSKRKLSGNSLIKLSKEFGVNIDWIENGEGEPFNDYSFFESFNSRFRYIVEYVKLIHPEHSDTLTGMLLNFNKKFKNHTFHDFEPLSTNILDHITQVIGVIPNIEWLLSGSGSPFIISDSEHFSQDLSEPVPETLISSLKEKITQLENIVTELRKDKKQLYKIIDTLSSQNNKSGL